MEENIDLNQKASSFHQGSKYFPGFIQAMGLIFLVYVIRNVTLVVIKYFISIALYENAIFRMGIHVIIFVIVILFFSKKLKSNRYSSNIFSPIRISLLMPISITIIGLIVGFAEIYFFVQLLLARFDHWDNYYVPLVEKHFLLSYITIGIINPIIEEIFFRGLILQGFIGRYPKSKAIILCSLLFGLSHQNIFTFAGTFCFGLLLSWWFIRTRSLLPCIAGHVLYNSLVIVIIYALLAVSNFEKHFQVLEIILLNVVIVIFIAFGIWLFNYIISKDSKEMLTVKS